jgi:hypothetical protein
MGDGGPHGGRESGHKHFVFPRLTESRKHPDVPMQLSVYNLPSAIRVMR